MDIHAINRRIINEAAKKVLAVEDATTKEYIPSRDAEDCKELARKIYDNGKILQELLSQVLRPVTRQGMKREFGAMFPDFSQDILHSLNSFLSNIDSHLNGLTEEMDVHARSATSVIVYHLWNWCRIHGNRNMVHDYRYEDGWVDVKISHYGEGEDAILTDAAKAFFDKTIADIQKDAAVTIEFREAKDGFHFLVCELNVDDL